MRRVFRPFTIPIIYAEPVGIPNIVRRPLFKQDVDGFWRPVFEEEEVEVDCCYCGEGSGSGSGVSEGIVLGCCSGLPNTLYATIVNSLGCACADGNVITLTYDGGVAWSGTGTFGCGHNATISVTFQGATGIGGECRLVFTCTVHFADACRADQTMSAGNTSCEPISLSSPGFAGCDCDIPPGSVTIVVTE